MKARGRRPAPVPRGTRCVARCVTLRVVVGVAAVLAPAASANGLVAQEVAPLIVLVRHAEKVDDSRDPALSVEGEARALALAGLIRDVPVRTVWTTDFERTRATVEPFALRAGLSPKRYDPSDLPALAATLRERGETALVVGHSNTTPALVAQLGGDPGPPIRDDEYDRVYLLRLLPGGEVTTTVLRY